MSEIQYLELDNSSIDKLVCFQKFFFKDLNGNISNHFALKKNQVYTLVAYSRNLIIGFLTAQRIIDNFEINSFFISPSFRRKGVGKKLLKKFIKNCTEKNIKTIFLEVMQSNTTAIKLYKKFRFLNYGSRKDYYIIDGSKFDAVLMKLILN